MTILLRSTTSHLEVKKVPDIDIVLSGRAFRGQNGTYCPRTVDRSVIPERTSQREENGIPVGTCHFVSIHVVVCGKFPGAFLDQVFQLPVCRRSPGPAPGDLGPIRDVITIRLGSIGPDIPVGPEHAKADINGARILDMKSLSRNRRRGIGGRDIDDLPVFSCPVHPGVPFDQEDEFVVPVPQVQDSAVRTHQYFRLDDITEATQSGVRIGTLHLLEGQDAGSIAILLYFYEICSCMGQPAHQMGLHGDHGKGEMAHAGAVNFGVCNPDSSGFRAEELVSVSAYQRAQVQFIGPEHIGPRVCPAGKPGAKRYQDDEQDLFHSLVTFKIR